LFACSKLVEDIDWLVFIYLVHLSSLYGADLRDAILAEADLTGAILAEAAEEGLIKANLAGADLTHADLTGAKVTQEQLNQARSLEGATMPNGQKYEEWLKSKGRGEDGKNSGPS
jgi:uncharacterized protein YjbI with pentapeptide repeats